MADAKHEATPDTRGKVYEYCECGAVRTLDRETKRYDDWHVCVACLIGSHAPTP